ncbi:MAG: hypothetical protein M1819_003610 [Sarea resinae]|nr:MAG: hypothetical protein M1819_003610 [Sarea resinae]
MAPPAKRRKKSTPAVEEVTFDFDARQEYLTGFHKRKLQRIKHAQEEAAKKEREERVEHRKSLREERKADLQRHVETVNAMLRKANGEDEESDKGSSENEEWGGFEEPPPVDHEAEYIDEDRYTTVTVEEMDLSKEGLHQDERKAEEAGDEDGKTKVADGSSKAENTTKKRIWSKDRPDKPKKKKKKFRYESKADRKVTRRKERAGGRAQAKARKE